MSDSSELERQQARVDEEVKLLESVVVLLKKLKIYRILAMSIISNSVV
jgi:hypothetical protein